MKSERTAARIFKTVEDPAQAAAEACLGLALKATEARGRFSIALAGSIAPKRLDALLADVVQQVLLVSGR